MIPHPEFHAYLKSVAQKYQCWSSLYTLTDTVGKQPELFDMGLMVQTWQPKQREALPSHQGQQQKNVERLPLLKGIRKYAKDHVLLVGKPGAGKSTALERLLWEEAKNCRGGVSLPKEVFLSGTKGLGKIPVLLKLREYQTSVLDTISNSFAEHDLYLHATEIESLLLNGQLLLLVDGLNELPDENARRELAVFRQKYYHRTPMIFTTRDVSIGGDFGINKQLEMQPLTKTQMCQFVRAYLGQHSEPMLRQLNDHLRKFAETPLLLWMLCRVYAQEEGKIPGNLGAAFQDFTSLYDNQLKGGVPTDQNSRSWWSELLQQLAFKMMQGAAPTELRLNISRREAEDILTQFLEREKFDKPRDYAKRWLEDLLEHHLIQTARNNQIEFCHQLIQEYYAAEYLLRQLSHISDAKLKRDYLNYLKWTEPVALMLALLKDEAQAMRVVQLALDVDSMLGARLAGEVKREFQEKTVGLVVSLSGHEFAKIEFLGITRSEYGVDFLINSLQYGYLNSREKAVYALGKIGSEKAVDALIHALKDKKNDVCISAVRELGKIGSEKAVDALIYALENEGPNARSDAARALGRIASEKAINALIHHALKDEHYSVRDSATNALGKIGSEKLVDVLIHALKGKDSTLRCSAAIALGEIGNKKAIRALIRALKDEDSKVRNSAANALGKIGSKKAVVPLIHTLKDEVLFIRCSAANALGRIGNEKAVNALIHGLKSEDDTKYWNYSYSFVCALGKVNIDSENALNAVIHALEWKNSSLRSSVADALEKIGTESSVDALIHALENEHSSVRSSATYALGSIGSEEAVDALIHALEHQDSNIRSNAAYALGSISSEKVVDSLIYALKDENSKVRSYVASALGNIGSEKAVDFLIRALEDETSEVCGNAAYALGNIGGEKAADALSNAFYRLRNEKPFKALSYIKSALVKIGGNQAIEVLIDMLKTEDLNYNYYPSTADTLGTIANSEILPQLYDLLINNGIIHAKDVILKIQDRCSFYKHELFNFPLEKEEKNHLQKTDKNPSETSDTQNTYNIQGKVGIINIGDISIKGDQIGIQQDKEAKRMFEKWGAIVRKLTRLMLKFRDISTL